MTKEELKEYKHKYYLEHKEEFKARSKKQYEKDRKNAEAIKKRLEWQKAYYWRNREEIMAKHREEYRKDPKKVIARVRAWQERNKTKRASNEILQ